MTWPEAIVVCVAFISTAVIIVAFFRSESRPSTAGRLADKYFSERRSGQPMYTYTTVTSTPMRREGEDRVDSDMEEQSNEPRH